MTLDEAIAHAREAATKNRRRFEDIYAQETATPEERAEALGCLDCSEDHVQLVLWLRELQERRKEGRGWIPTEKEEPKEDGYYFVTINYFGDPDVRISYFDPEDKRWSLDNVTAWQPLPEPYKQEETT